MKRNFSNLSLKVVREELDTPGLKLWWRHTPRGGYGYWINVPAIFVKLNKTTVTIQALKKDGTWKTVRVKIENLRKRA